MSSPRPMRSHPGVLIGIASLAIYAIVAALWLGPPAFAQATVTWHQTKGPSGGKINVLLIDRQNPSIVFAATDGGVFTSLDGGASWERTSEGLPGGEQVISLAIAPVSAPVRTIYAGTFNGLYRSSDGGRTWSAATLGLTQQPVFSLAVDPANPSVLYAGTDAQVFKSTDAGDTWAPHSEGLPERTIWCLSVDPSAPHVVHAGTDGGVYKSIDGARQWQSANVGIPTGLRVQRLAINPQDPAILYATTEGGVYRSLDRGDSWKVVDGGIGTTIVHDLVVDPARPYLLYGAVGNQGIWRSTNSGDDWEATIGNIDEVVFTLAIHPLNPQVIYAGTGRGVYCTSNAGQRWEPRNKGLISTSCWLLAADPRQSGHLYSSTGVDVYKTINGGETWSSINEGLARPNVLALAVDPLSPQVLYAGTWYSEVYRSVDEGRTWRLVNGGLAPNAPISSLLVYHTAEDGKDEAPGVVYAGTNGAGVFRSQDGGVEWTAINEGLDDLRVQVVALGGESGSLLYAGTGKSVCRLDLIGELVWRPAQEGLPQDEVRSIAIDPRAPNTIYAALAAGIGEVYRSTDAGSTWAAVGQGSLPTNVLIQALAFSSPSTRGRRLYAGTDGGVFRSEDGGLSWRATNDGLPARANVLALQADAKGPHLYASISNSGVYASVDAGTGQVAGSPLTVLVLGTTLVTATVLVLRWLHDSSESVQQRMLEQNWPIWRQHIRQLLYRQNKVSPGALSDVPRPVRLRALQRYVQEERDEDLVLRVDPPVLRPANPLQLEEFTRNWSAAQKRLDDPAAFRPVVARLTDQLCQLLGFTQIDSRSYKNLHGYVLKAPALRLKMPSTFPIIFLQQRNLDEEDMRNLDDLMDILNVPSYLALLVAPDNIPLSADRGLKAHFRTLRHGTAHDYILMDYDDVFGIFLAKDPEKRFISILLEQVDLSVVSPYVTSGPVPESMFFGREYELKTITRTIKDQSFAMVGARKIGKTSILAKLHRILTDLPEFLPQYLDCQAVQTYDDFYDATETRWNVTWEDRAPEQLVQLVPHIRRGRNEHLIVFLLDEVDALLDYDKTNQERLFKVFRALSQEGLCSFVFCGGRTLHRTLHDARSALFNFGQVLHLSYLRPRDTARIVTEPMQEMGIAFEDASKLIQRIVDLSACHPNLVQYICHQLIVHIKGRGDRLITLADLDAIESSKEFSEYFAEVMWGSSTALERLITLLMLDKTSITLPGIKAELQQHNVSVSPTVLEQALDGLMFCSILSLDKQQYYFAAPALPSIVAVTQDVEALLEKTLQEVQASGRF